METTDTQHLMQSFPENVGLADRAVSANPKHLLAATFVEQMRTGQLDNYFGLLPLILTNAADVVISFSILSSVRSPLERLRHAPGQAAVSVPHGLTQKVATGGGWPKARGLIHMGDLIAQ